MFKGVRVTYPKRRKTKDELTVHEIQEPVRKSMHDVVMENFRVLKRVTFVHRVIYVGEHLFDKDDEELENLFRSIIQSVNDASSAEKLSGFLLCYSKYFIHLVEGDEDSIYKHLGMLQNSKKRATYLGTIKLLIQVSHISRRLIKDWVSYVGIPAQYLGKINIDNDLEEAGRHIYNCIRKMYNLVFSYVHDLEDGAKHDGMKRSSSTFTQDEITAQRLSKTRSTTSNFSLRVMSGHMGSATDPYRNCLPEQEIVDFTLKTSFTQDIKDYCGLYGVVPQRLIYKDRTWPCPEHFIQYDVFTKPYDTCTEFPKSITKQELEKSEVSGEGNEVSEGNTAK